MHRDERGDELDEGTALRRPSTVVGVFFLGCFVQVALFVLVVSVMSRWASGHVAMAVAGLATEVVPLWVLVRVIRTPEAAWSNPSRGEVHPVLLTIGVLGWAVGTALVAYMLAMWVDALQSI